MFIEKIDKIGYVESIDIIRMVNIGSLYRVRSSAVFIKKIYQESYIERIDNIAAIDVAANIIAGITQTIAIVIGLIGVIDIRAVVDGAGILGMPGIAIAVIIGINTYIAVLIEIIHAHI